MRPMGRNTQGVRLVNLKDGDKLVGVELVSAEDLTQYAATTRTRKPLPPPTEGLEDDSDAPEVVEPPSEEE
jgi:DNA gyrase/topoisomerase IV subunit A